MVCSLGLASLAWFVSLASPDPSQALGRAVPPQRQKPNVVLIVADDLGYGELGCYGGRQIPTPNIDSIAKHGVRLTDGYVSCPVCAPTRAGLMTGRYGPRFGFEFNPGPQTQSADNFGLPKSEKTLAERMKAIGYATGMVGKWHLGYRSGYTPTDRGFDSFFGFLGGAHAYQGQRRGAAILRGRERVVEREYLTDAFAREAVAFVNEQKAKPFFLYLPFNAVHSPLQAPTDMEERLKPFKNEKRRTFAAMLMKLDDAVGRVLECVRKNGLEDNTLIFFIGDNGGPTPQTTCSNGPLRGTKGQTWEGGIRVPYIVQWKGRLTPSTFSQAAIALDIVSTAMAAAGSPVAAAEKLDGVDLMPFLTGKDKGAPHDTLYWRFGQQRAIRSGDWKLVTAAGAQDALFNLKQDIAEKQNLADSEPERLKALKAAWDTWSNGLADPLWKRSGKVR